MSDDSDRGCYRDNRRLLDPLTLGSSLVATTYHRAGVWSNCNGKRSFVAPLAISFVPQAKKVLRPRKADRGRIKPVEFGLNADGSKNVINSDRTTHGIMQARLQSCKREGIIEVWASITAFESEPHATNLDAASAHDRIPWSYRHEISAARRNGKSD